jgi:hypothetical protein
VTNSAEPNEARVVGLHPVDFVLALVVASLCTALVLLDRLVVPAFAKMYADFGSDAVLPLVTRAVLAHVATFGGAAGAVALAVTGILVRRRGGSGLAVGLLLGGIVFAIGAVAFSMYGLYAPMFELAGKIKP